MASQTSEDHGNDISLIDFDEIEAEADHNLTDVDGAFPLDTDIDALRDTDMTTLKDSLSHDDIFVEAQDTMKLNASSLSSSGRYTAIIRKICGRNAGSRNKLLSVSHPGEYFDFNSLLLRFGEISSSLIMTYNRLDKLGSLMSAN